MKRPTAGSVGLFVRAPYAEPRSLQHAYVAKRLRLARLLGWADAPDIRGRLDD